MTMQAFPLTVYPSISEEVENQLMVELAQEFADEIFSELEETFPGYILSPSVELPPRERLERYLLRLLEAYPQDEMGRMAELYMVLDTDYVDKFKQGLYPPPLALPWRSLVRVPRVFKFMQQDLRRVYLAYAKKVGA